MTGQVGVIYLLCFTQPYRHARHYVQHHPALALVTDPEDEHGPAA